MNFSQKISLFLFLSLAVCLSGICDDAPPFNPGDPSPIPVDGGISLLLILVFIGGIIAGVVKLASSSRNGNGELVPNSSVGDWILQYLVAAIPVIGFIILIVWALDDTNKLRKNWAIATLIWLVIIILISIIFFVVIAAAFSKFV